MRAPTVVLAFALLVSGCASASAPEAGRNMNLLSRADIESTNHMNALDIVRSERPQWLFRRGSRTVSGDTDIVVYLDGTRLGGPEMLAEIPAITVDRMRFSREREAQFRWGVGHLHGAVEVITVKG